MTTPGTATFDQAPPLAARRDPRDPALALMMAATTRRLTDDAQRAQWRGIDLHDGLYWRWPDPFIAKPLGRQLIQQLHARSPVDIRASRRGLRPRLAKTMALFTKAALLAGEVVDDPRWSEAGRSAALALDADRSAGTAAWGYPFAVQTRWSSYAANSPNIVVTSFAIDALVLASERLGEPRFAERARTAAAWIVHNLLTGDGHFAYHAHSHVLIHNANLLGAAAVHRALGETEVVRSVVERSLEAQRADGSWPYGAPDNLAFVDSVHTGYVISSLIALGSVSRDIAPAVARGARYWTEHFFDRRGRSLLWPDRRFPEDGHSAGTALSTLARLADGDPSHLPLLRQVARRALTAMVRENGAVHRRYRWGRTRVRYVRWCDGHMALGMAAGAARLLGRHDD